MNFEKNNIMMQREEMMFFSERMGERQVCPPRMSLQMAALQNNTSALKQWHEWSIQGWRSRENPPLRGRDSWAWDVREETGLHFAARAGDSSIVEALLKSGDCAKWSNDLAEYPLMVAAAAGHLGTVEVFLQNKPHPFTVSTALSVASNKEVAEALVRHVKPRAMNSALIKAVQFDRPVTVSALLAAGACPNVKTPYGSPALSVASTGGQYACAVLLLAYGADVGAHTNFGQRPLHCAAMCGNTDVLCEILFAGADVDQKDSENGTALFYAARFGKLHTAEVLLSAGANIHARDIRAWTALHVAAFEGRDSVAMYLLSQGANPTARNKQGKAPWQLARTTELKDTLRNAQRVKRVVSSSRRKQ